MTWNHRILHDAHGGYRLIEVYCDTDDTIVGWCEVDSPRGEVLEEMKQDLDWQRTALDAPVLEHDKLPPPVEDTPSTDAILDRLLAGKGLNRNSLRTFDFRQTVHLQLGDGGKLTMLNAFAVADEDHIGVFTEHNGHHLFPAEEAELACVDETETVELEPLDDDLLKRVGLVDWRSYAVDATDTVEAIAMERVKGILCRSGDGYFLRIPAEDSAEFLDVELHHSDPDVVFSDDLAIYRHGNRLILDHAPQTLGYEER